MKRYGSVVSTHLLHAPAVSNKIKSIVLIDPVTFLLHLPDVAYNFVRTPQLHHEPRNILIPFLTSSTVNLEAPTSTSWITLRPKIWELLILSQDVSFGPRTLSGKKISLVDLSPSCLAEEI